MTGVPERSGVGEEGRSAGSPLSAPTKGGESAGGGGGLGMRGGRPVRGEAASKMLLALMRGEAVQQPVVNLGFELIARGSA